MDRRDFLRLTAAAPSVGLISMVLGSLRMEGNGEKGDHLNECLAGSIDLTAPGADMYSSHCLFYADIPFTSKWITLEVVPMFKCFNQLMNGNTYHMNRYSAKNSKPVLVNAFLDLSLGSSPGSEVSYIADLHLRKENQYNIPFSIPKGSRLTLRIKDDMESPTKYKAHMVITGASV